MIIKTIPLGMLGTNSYLLIDEPSKEAVIIDLGGDYTGIFEEIKRYNANLKYILNTHGHFDHMLALAELKAATGARLSIFEKTERFLEDRVLNLCHYMGIELSPTKADNILYDGDIINFGENRIMVIATPGHTEDCICLLCGKTLISGDTLFRLSVGRWDHPTGNMKEEIESIQNRLMTLDDDVSVYPGHGEPTTIGDERRGNPYIG